MSFSASQKNVNELLSRNCSYLIPRNQRKYVWGETEWSEIFEDIFLIEQSTDDYAHFLGSFVLSKTKKQNEYYVVDGQQRLITIAVLLCCMASKLFEADNPRAAESIVEHFLLGNKDGEDFYKIARDDGPLFLPCVVDALKEKRTVTIDTAQNLFKATFESKDRYNRKILDCYQYFLRRINEYIDAEEKTIFDTVCLMESKLTGCQGIEIIVESDAEGFRVFETLNARGIPLEQHELLKNYFYTYLRCGEKRKNLDSKWEKIIANVVTERTDYFPLFLTHYCVHKFGKIKKSEEFKTIRDKTDKKKACDLLTSIYRCSIYYAYIINPEKYIAQADASYAVYESLNFFHCLNIRQVRPVVLSLFEALQDNKTIDEKDFKGAMSLLENFYFMYVTLLKGTTNKIDDSIVSLAKKISESTSKINASSLIKNELSRFVSERGKIKEEFKTIGFSNKNAKFNNSSNKKCVNYIFEKIEKSLDVNDEIGKPKIASIEHIYNDDESYNAASYIGNLLPLSKKLNNKISNKDFKNKIDFYKKSSLLTVKDFLKHHGDKTTWDENDIMARGAKLSEYCFDTIWIF